VDSSPAQFAHRCLTWAEVQSAEQAAPLRRQLGQAPSGNGLIAVSLPLQVQQTQAEARQELTWKHCFLLEWKLGSRWRRGCARGTRKPIPGLLGFPSM